MFSLDGEDEEEEDDVQEEEVVGGDFAGQFCLRYLVFPRLIRDR